VGVVGVWGWGGGWGGGVGLVGGWWGVVGGCVGSGRLYRKHGSWKPLTKKLGKAGYIVLTFHGREGMVIEFLISGSEKMEKKAPFKPQGKKAKSVAPRFEPKEQGLVRAF